MAEKETNDFGTVSSQRIENIITKMKRDKGLPEDAVIQVPFSMLIVSCFPKLWETFSENMKQVHQDGYIDGYEYGREVGRKELLEELENEKK